MARTLTAATTTEKDKVTGAFPRRILEVQFASGTKFYSDEILTSPVACETELILNMGEISISSEAGKKGGMASVEITLSDEDLFWLQKNETKPGIQKTDAFLWTWFVGTSWATDRVLELGGMLTVPMKWEEKKAEYKVRLVGFEHVYDKPIGVLASVDIFPEINCSECENTLIPIAYGEPVYRVPACIVDRPGRAILASELNVVPDTTLTIASTAAEANFTTGSSITLIVGIGNRWEKITGSFASGGTSTFVITSRGAIQAEGTIPGFYASGGQQFITVTRTDLTNPDTSRAGYPLYLQEAGGDWFIIPITHWKQSGVNQVVAPKGNLTLVTGDDWKIGTVAGWIPVWPPGSYVYELGTFKYAVNFLPSQAVLRIEARTPVNIGGGDRKSLWLEINPIYYTVNLNDKSYNAELGRDPVTDDGITSVTLLYSPTQLGLDSDMIWTTLNGIEQDPDATPASGTISNPSDVLYHLLTNPWLGNVPSVRVNSASFTTAKALIDTKMSFALFDERQQLNDLLVDLAYQANSLLFVDAGEYTMVKLVRPLTLAMEELRITRNELGGQKSLLIEDRDVKQYITELSSRFRPAIPATEMILTRDSVDGKTDFGIQRDEMDLWAYQFPTSVALTTEFWLEYLLETNRRVTFTTYLNALHIQPGDMITLDIEDGAGNKILNCVFTQVVSIKRTLGDLKAKKVESATITVEFKMYDYTISASVPSDVGCLGNIPEREYRRSGRLYLQSSGRGRSLYVQQPAKYPGEGGNVANPAMSNIDPTTDMALNIGAIFDSGFPTPASDCPP